MYILYNRCIQYMYIQFCGEVDQADERGDGPLEVVGCDELLDEQLRRQRGQHTYGTEAGSY